MNARLRLQLVVQDVQRQAAEAEVQKAQKALEAVEEAKQKCEAKLEDHRELQSKAKTQREKSGCAAAVMKWQNKLAEAEEAVSAAEEKLKEVEEAKLRLDEELEEQKKAKEAAKEEDGAGAEDAGPQKAYDIDAKTEKMTEGASEAVGKIGSALLEMTTGKMILMMLLTLIFHILLEVPGTQGVQQQYGMTMMKAYSSFILPALYQYTRGDPIGSHFDELSELIYLKVHSAV